MSDTTNQPATETAPADKLPAGARTPVYIGCLAANVVVVVGFGLASIFGWLPTEQATEALVLIVSAIGMVSSGLGVAYRPTRGGR